MKTKDQPRRERDLDGHAGRLLPPPPRPTPARGRGLWPSTRTATEVEDRVLAAVVVYHDPPGGPARRPSVSSPGLRCTFPQAGRSGRKRPRRAPALRTPTPSCGRSQQGPWSPPLRSGLNGTRGHRATAALFSLASSRRTSTRSTPGTAEARVGGARAASSHGGPDRLGRPQPVTRSLARRGRRACAGRHTSTLSSPGRKPSNRTRCPVPRVGTDLLQMSTMGRWFCRRAVGPGHPRTELGQALRHGFGDGGHHG